MKTHLKLRLVGWLSVWAVLLNGVFEYAPLMREDAAMVCGVMMICFGIVLKELQEQA